LIYRREDQEAQDEAQKKAEEKQRLEEQAQREHEEYMKMKEAFSVEEEGCNVPDPEDEGNLLENFVVYIKVRIRWAKIKILTTRKIENHCLNS